MMYFLLLGMPVPLLRKYMYRPHLSIIRREHTFINTEMYGIPKKKRNTKCNS